MKTATTFFFFGLASLMTPSFASDCDGVCSNTNKSIISNYAQLISNVKDIKDSELAPPLEDQFLTSDLHKTKCGRGNYVTEQGQLRKSVSLTKAQRDKLIADEGVITVKRYFYDNNKSFIGPKTKIKAVHSVTVSARSCVPLGVGLKEFRNNCDDKFNKQIKSEYASITKNIDVQPTHVFALKDGLAYYDLNVSTYDSMEALDHGDIDYLEIRSVVFDAKTCKPVNDFKKKVY